MSLDILKRKFNWFSWSKLSLFNFSAGQTGNESLNDLNDLMNNGLAEVCKGKPYVQYDRKFHLLLKRPVSSRR
jgi:hypothetical protein